MTAWLWLVAYVLIPAAAMAVMAAAHVLSPRRPHRLDAELTHRTPELIPNRRKS